MGQRWAFLGVRGCEGPQPSQEDHSSLDQDLEGVRSRAAVLVDPSFVCRNKGWANVGPSLGSAAARDCSLQVREDHWSLDQDLEGVRSLGAVLIDPSFVLPQQGLDQR